MDKLSYEVLNLIAAYLYVRPWNYFSTPDPERKSRMLYPTISREWQHTAERWTFERIRFTSNELTTFASLFAEPRRRALLRRLGYTVLLPTFGDSRHDFARNQAAFTDAIQGLLNILKDWESEDVGSLELQISTDWDVDQSTGPITFDFTVQNSSSIRRFLTLDGKELPKVRCVTAFIIENSSPGRALHPTAICQLSNVFPQLERLELDVEDPMNKRREMRKEHRRALAAGLLALDLPRLTYLRISRQTNTTVRNHSFDCGNLEDDGIDPLNDALRKLSQSSPLVHLELIGGILVSSDLFLDRRAHGHDSSVWPTLRSFRIQAEIIAPNGKWYYTGDPKAVEAEPISYYSSSDDEDAMDSSTEPEDDESRDAVANGREPTHEWRVQPDPNTFNPLAESMADAVLRMPRLASGTLEIEAYTGQYVDLILICAEAGEDFIRAPGSQFGSPEDKRVRRWHVWVGPDTKWEAPVEVKTKWREWLGENGKATSSIFSL
ncbi:uncharacterized protein F4822DRAFT_287214 [Hypoxylon trugodes]|uniref:uncharacterized protein n=1 Tax=Hypoxylon trugodes TaxID=326681 RepID=UPI00219F28DB|nr:uncharacterized protein F4822DRAFT_287214 [Hypoxylon trugodes]KAI1387574.1 hypothetical protein F4822DRAFT_287214 [Hypoxylon trugodes]